MKAARKSRNSQPAKMFHRQDYKSVVDTKTVLAGRIAYKGVNRVYGWRLDFLECGHVVEQYSNYGIPAKYKHKLCKICKNMREGGG